jgi:dTDP-4-dehydrorhamnose 3,5-epimerase-like enzyme
MIKNNFQIIKLNIKKTKNKKGWLMPFHFLDSKNKDNQLPIKIKRIFIIGGVKKGDIRGEHALFKTNQIITVLKGKVLLELDDGKDKKRILLQSPQKAILVKPLIWRTLKILEDDTLILVFCDREHNEKDYIRNYENFIQQVRKKIYRK